WVNNPNFRFTGRIHENLIYTDNSFKPYSFFSNINVFHTGYMQDEINRKNKMDRNLALLQEAIKEEPHNGFHEYNLAIQYKNMGKLDQAVKHFNLMEEKQKEGEISPYCIFGISALSSTYIQMKQYEKAIGEATKILKINENFKEALFNLGLAQYYLGDYDNAIKNFSKIIDDKRNEIVIGGVMDQAIRSWKTLNLIGICYIGLNNYTYAIKNLRKAFKINKYSGETLLNLITAYYQSNKINEIVNLLEKIKNIKYPLHIIEQILQKLYSFGLSKRAISFLNAQKENYSSGNELDDIESKFIQKADFYKANIYYERKKYKDADIFFSKYFNNDEFDVDAMSKWGLSNLCIKNYQKAEEIFERILDENQQYWNVFHNLGTAKMSLEKLDEAISLFKKAKELNPGSVETYLNLGKIYLYKKEYLNAIEMLNYAAFLDKEYKNKEIFIHLANALYFTGSYDKALEKALLYLKLNGPDPECFYIAGLSYYMTGDFINSSLYFSKAISLDNEKVDYFIYLGNSLKKLRMFEEAEVFYRHVLMKDKANIQAQAGYAAILLENSLKNLC
ncbi:tetratricopeptide repeat protein, partial [bacterium]|nr:tetratricopeptide repeat protein [bacterium]